MRLNPHICCVLFLLTALAANADEAPVLVDEYAAHKVYDDDSEKVPTVDAVRLEKARIDIDGQLTEEVWQTTRLLSKFTQRSPHPGAPALRRTDVRLFYDEQALYIGARLYDTPDSIAARLFRRDGDGFSDWFGVGIDGFNNDRTAFAFYVNPRGVKRDELLFNDTESNASWDAVWSAEVQMDDAGWAVEMRIPFSQLRYAADDNEQDWGINFVRIHARSGEESYWSPILPDVSGMVSRYGTLRGMKDLVRPRSLEIEPYISGQLARRPGSGDDPFHAANDFGSSIGADVTYGITSDLTLSATVNPDFGQVEVDPAVINLSAYETFFPEKRPFFVEGMDSYEFGETRTHIRVNPPFLFYSRRIGQAPHRRLQGYTYEDAPEQTTIAGAAKLSGKIGENWSVGVLNAVTLPEKGRYVADGAQHSALVEPLTNYAVGRLRRQFSGGNAWAGGFLTSVHRNLEEAALQDMLHRQAYVGGMDFEYAWGERSWIASGYLAASHVRGSADAIAGTQQSSARYLARPDAPHLSYDPDRESLTGHSIQLALQKVGGEHWRSSYWYMEMSPQFEVNDLGFQIRGDYRVISTYQSYQESASTRNFRSYGFSGYGFSAWNYGGTLLAADVQLRANAQLHNFWRIEGGMGYGPSTTSDRLTRGGPLAGSPSAANTLLSITTDSRKDLSFNASGDARRDAVGSWNRTVSGSVEWRPSAAMQVSVGPEFARSRSVAQYVAAIADPLAETTFGRRYVFATLDQTTLSVPLRLNWTFSPDLSLQLFAQPFIAAGNYSAFKEFARPGEFEFAVYGEDAGTLEETPQGAYRIDPDGSGSAQGFELGNPDFNLRSLRGSAVLRWQYRPGSALYFVWQQQRSDAALIGDFGFTRDYGALFRAPAENVFVVKLTYWLGT